MKRLIIADSHLGQRAGDGAAMCDLLDRALQRGFAEVIYLGDSFQYLIGMSKFWTATVRQVVGQWQAIRRDGCRVVLIEGNRDFFLDEPELAAEVDFAGLSYDFHADARHVLLVHGDKVNLRDLQYRFWSTVSKCAPARLWARLLPRGMAVWIVESMERRLATTNRKYRYLIPDADLRRDAAKAWARGVDVVLWGHFHERWQISKGSGLAVVLPAWLDTQLALAVDADGAMNLVDGDLNPVQGGEIRPEVEPEGSTDG